MGCLPCSPFSWGLSSVWVFMPAPSWSPAHCQRKPVRRLSVCEEGWGGWDKGAGQSQPSEGVQYCVDGERLGRRDLIFRTASSCLLPLFLHLYHGSFEGSGVGERSRVNSGRLGEKRSRQVRRMKRGHSMRERRGQWRRTPWAPAV